VAAERTPRRNQLRVWECQRGDVRSEEPDRKLSFEHRESPCGDEHGQEDQEADQHEREERAQDAAADQDEEVGQSKRKRREHVEGVQVRAWLPQDVQEPQDPTPQVGGCSRGGALQGSSDCRR